MRDATCLDKWGREEKIFENIELEPTHTICSDYNKLLENMENNENQHETHSQDLSK